MSRIFTFEEIEQRRVPTVEDFTWVVQMLREQLPTLPNFSGAVIFGSALTGKYCRTSDVDVFVTFDEDGLRLSQETKMSLNELTRRAQLRHVPIDWLPNTRQQLRQGLHTVRSGGLDHIAWGANHGGLIGVNPVVCHTVNRRAEARTYTLFAMDELVRAEARLDSLSEVDRNKVRSKAFDRPVAAARRFMELANRDVCALASGQVVQALANQKLLDLWSLSEGYKRRLELHLRQPDRKKYGNAMRVIDARALPLAHDFLAELSKLLA